MKENNVVDLEQFRKKKRQSKINDLKSELADVERRYQEWMDKGCHTKNHPGNPLYKEIEFAERMGQHIVSLGEYIKSHIKHLKEEIAQHEKKEEAHAANA